MVRRVLGDTLRCIGVSENCVSDVLLATSEACANAVRHGGPSKRYEVTAAIGQGRCELRVVDNGLGIGAVPRQYPPGDAEHGRGILIMQSVVDEIFFDITPGSGTTVLLRKELDWDEDFLARHDRELAAV
ncbi:ATP-binding protein [Sphaerisporangium siamense]|uniref:ATP-binding protein n=1 Tax=Sphaerisporangium siamense TaxID=795645 RepID=UPI0019521F39|nr:ATP-binding protein [Sphaerisporangium siamense]